MISVIAIRMKKSLEPIQEITGAVSGTAGLVIIKDHWARGISGDSVYPHIALLLCFPPFFLEDHEAGLIRVQDLVFQEFLPQCLKHPGKPMPVGI